MHTGTLAGDIVDYPRYVAAMTRANERRFWTLVLTPIVIASVAASVVLFLLAGVAWWVAAVVGVGVFNVAFMSLHLADVQGAIRRRARREAEQDWSAAHVLYLLRAADRGDER